MIKKNGWILLIITVAAALRLHNLWYMEFKADEAAISFLALEFVSGSAVPLVSDISSIGTWNPPISVYLLSIPFYLSCNPVHAAAFVAILNIIAVYLCYIFIKEFFDERSALIAAAFFAINPWAVIYSRKIWSQNLLVLPVVLFYLSLFKAVYSGQRWFFALSFFFLAIAAQLHLTAASHGMVLIMVLLWQREKITRGPLLSGIGLFLLTCSPYLFFEVKHNFIDWRSPFLVGMRPLRFHADALAMPAKLVATMGFFKRFPVPVLEYCLLIFVVCAGVYCFFCWRDSRYRILCVGLLCAMGMHAVNRMFYNDIYTAHYFIAQLPLYFIIIALCAGSLYEKAAHQRGLRMFYGCFLAILIGYQGITTADFIMRLPAERNIRWLGYGPPFKYRVEEVRSVMNRGLTAPGAIHMAVSENNHRFKYDYQATCFIVEHMSKGGAR